ncbi:MAG TPA: YbfB/YjiJ family MFS transporter [Candidatus Eisenbacteria bacterium]|nr:YbfB/YjiJ family MFS transporter [Candidatus Eisenbacteria bacterium]
MTAKGPDTRAWRATLAGLSASLVGIGLARFAYTPLLPVLITAGWFPASQAAYLGAANLAGYLGGALCARPLARWGGAPRVLRGMMTLVTVAFFACALPLSFSWFFLWRFASGVAGGTLMVLAAPTVLPHVPPARRGLAGGAIFTGVGLGIMASGTVVPLLLQAGLAVTWCGLGVLSMLLTGLAWGRWPADEKAAATPIAAARRAPATGTLRALYVEYALNATGLVPHMVFLVDFVARGLGQGIHAGAQYWVLFGVGAVAGPVLAGLLADRVGFGPALRLALVAQAAAVAVPVVTAAPVGLALSSVLIGAAVPGIVPLVLGRVHELVPGDPEGQRAAWSVTTMAFALGQAAGAYGLSFLFARGGRYPTLFAVGTAALTLALVIDVTARLAGRKAI